MISPCYPPLSLSPRDGVSGVGAGFMDDSRGSYGEGQQDHHDRLHAGVLGLGNTGFGGMTSIFHLILFGRMTSISQLISLIHSFHRGLATCTRRRSADNTISAPCPGFVRTPIRDYGLLIVVYGLWIMVYGLWFIVYGLWQVYFVVYDSG